MKYRDLIEFDPIETVIQLRAADKPSDAEELVRTYVISDSMATDLVHTVFPHLQFVKSHDHKGLLVVGNYGTGKSHLMAMITSIAENENLIQYVRNPAVREKTEGIAGRFKVIRAEIGATQMGLRDIVIRELENGLERMGLKFKFPSADQITNNKDSITEMMTEFGEMFPDKGLIFALDELLDYLRGRREQELVQDLIFLRELGEVCKDTRFRFVAGVQEAIFDSPSLQFVSESLRRVKARFQEVFIRREDVEYVISERLLRKNARQRDLIRIHLEKFSSYYSGIAERIGKYVDLFPVHPSYIEVFEQIHFVEKREVLKTLSEAISKLLDKELPSEEVGLLTYDMYWENIKNDPSFNSIRDVALVREKSSVLENKMGGFPRAHYKSIALKLIFALSVQRLTTEIRGPIGTTVEELRDQLCVPFPEGTPDQMRNEEDLKGIISTILGLVMQTVSGQYISFNKENGQYYIDVEKDVDYDQLIKDKAGSLDNSIYDRYYFDALAGLMECAETTYRTGFKIWEHELLWTPQNTARLGYLFFGEPNSRSTAQPPRDFYIYFLPFFEAKKIDGDYHADEVFFKLVTPEEELLDNIRLYAGARELEKKSTVGSKDIFRSKATSLLRAITHHIYGNSAKIFDVVYQGSTEKIVKYLKRSTSTLTFKEIVDHVASDCLSTHFQDQAPEYPKFGSPVTGSNREQVVKDALRALAADSKTRLGATMLDGLELLDGDYIKSSVSRYARHVLDLLNKKDEGVVLNRDELIKSEFGVPFEIRYRLEPELLIVVLAALVRDGQIEINVAGKRFTAANLDDLVKTPIGELVEFKYIQKPKDYPISTLKRVFELLGVNPGLVNNPEYLSDAVVELQKRVSELVPKVVESDQRLKNGFQLMGILFFSEEELKSTREYLDSLKKFLESLQRFNTEGKLRNCRYAPDYLNKIEGYIKVFEDVRKLEALVSEVFPLSSYLSGAESVLPSDDEWVLSYKDQKTQFAPLLMDEEERLSASSRSDLIQEFSRLKQDYIERYCELHRKSRLDASYDASRDRLVKDPMMERLNKLSTLDLLPNSRLSDYWNGLASLKTCFSLHKDELQSVYVCPHCGFRPVEEPFKGVASAIFLQYEKDLETINEEWDQIILDNLRDPMVQQAMDVLKSEEREVIDSMIDSGQVPDKITNELLTILKQVFTGLVKVEVSWNNLMSDLSRGGMPCTVDEYQKRFEAHLRDLTQGKDKSKIRIILEE